MRQVSVLACGVGGLEDDAPGEPEMLLLQVFFFLPKTGVHGGGSSC